MNAVPLRTDDAIPRSVKILVVGTTSSLTPMLQTVKLNSRYLLSWDLLLDQVLLRNLACISHDLGAVRILLWSRRRWVEGAARNRQRKTHNDHNDDVDGGLTIRTRATSPGSKIRFLLRSNYAPTSTC
jgi:hypothetical protein